MSTSLSLILPLLLIFSFAAAQPCADNCADCGGDPSVCYACHPSFQLSVLSKCIPQNTNSRCSLYGPTTSCFVCQPTYQVQNSKCVKDYSGCLNLLNGNCIQCGFGTLMQDGKCVGTINCENSQKECPKCANGFRLQNNKCYPEKGCKQFDQAIGVCKQCQAGFDLVGYECIKQSLKVYDCYIYKNNKDNKQNISCSTCKYGYIPYEGQCLLPDDIQYIQLGNKSMDDIVRQKKGRYDAAYGKQAVSIVTETVTTSSTSTSTPTTITPTTTNTSIVSPLPIPSSPSSTQSPTFTIANCKIADSINKICALCEDRYYRSDNQCAKVKDSCKDYDMTNGQCTSCPQSLALVSGDCLLKVVSVPTTTTTNANTTGSSTVSSNNVPGGAVIISTTTNSQTSTTVITSVINTPSSTSKDPNCLKTDSTTNCIQCSNRYFLTTQRLCSPVNPLCQNYNEKGACTSCYKGYKILGEVCIPAQSKDPYCKETDSSNNCKSCFDGYFLNSSKICQTVNPLCKTSDLSNGYCKSCYLGYTLTDGSCKIFVKDPNCQEYDASNSCIKCPSRFYLNQGTCKSVNPLCKDYDKITGLCTECYPGYSNDKGACLIATSKTQDLNCKQKKNGVCVSCYNGFYLNSKSGKCEIQNLICKTINPENGYCLTCYNGYVIQGTTCALASLETSDLYCKKFDSQKLCTECYSGYFVDQSGICIQFDPTCKQNDKKTGVCISCYSGFNLINGKCVSDIPALGLNADQYCIKVEGTKCLECNKGYFVALNNVCTQVDILCKSYSLENGFCTSCYTGYVLSNGKCILGQDLYIPFCKQSNSQGKCVQCNDRYYLSKEGCTSISLLCDSYNKTTGKCITCTPGYFFQNDECIYPALGIDPGCMFYTNSYCTKCKLGSYLQNYFCKDIDAKCLQFDYTKNTCTKCFNSIPQGPACF